MIEFSNNLTVDNIFEEIFFCYFFCIAFCGFVYIVYSEKSYLTGVDNYCIKDNGFVYQMEDS